MHVNKFLYRRGGAEAYMHDVAALQASAGHEVAFFGMQHDANPPYSYEAHFPAQIDLEPPPSTLLGKLQSAGRMVWSTSARRGMQEVVESFRPEVVHLHNIYHQLSPSILQPLARHRVPAVMTLHDYKLVCPRYDFLANGKLCEACLGGHFHRAVIKRCKQGSVTASGLLAFELALHTATKAYEPVGIFIAPSEFLASKIRAGGVFPERLRVLNSFVDAWSVAPKDFPGGNVLYVGRLSTEKGVDVAIDAMARLPHGIELDVVGDGPEEAPLKARAAQQAPGRVRFHGRLPRAEVLERLRSSAVAVLPSRCYENQPIAVLEAFACGVPVVATSLGGVPELVKAGVHGELVPPNDPDALARALAGLLEDTEVAMAMGRRARAFVEDRFSPEKHLAGLEGLYAEAGARSRW